MEERKLNAIKGLLDEGLSTDGARHKQWYMLQIAAMLGMDVSGYEEGIPG